MGDVHITIAFAQEPRAPPEDVHGEAEATTAAGAAPSSLEVPGYSRFMIGADPHFFLHLNSAPPPTLFPSLSLLLQLARPEEAEAAELLRAMGQVR